MWKLLAIAGGGGAGAVCRYLLATGAQKLTGTDFPLGTLMVNVIGCFFLGLLGYLLTGPLVVREEYRLALLVGFLGGFTTFSTFGFDTFSLLNDGQRGLAFANIFLSNGLGLLAVWLGYRLGEAW